jgi:hypothetical protein
VKVSHRIPVLDDDGKTIAGIRSQSDVVKSLFSIFFLFSEYLTPLFEGSVSMGARKRKGDCVFKESERGLYAEQQQRSSHSSARHFVALSFGNALEQKGERSWCG